MLKSSQHDQEEIENKHWCLAIWSDLGEVI